MRKVFLLLGLLGVFSFGAVALVNNNNFKSVYAEENEIATYSITYSQPEHGKVVIAEEDLKGEVGKTIDINIDSDMFYLIKSVSVNGSALVESETTKGLYSFTPVAGDNVIAVELVLDEALFAEFNALAQDAKNKDWASLFSPEFIVRVISVVFSSGLLLAMVVYFIKDKKLSKKVEDKVEKVLESKITPELQEKVAEKVSEALLKKFDEANANDLRIMQGMAVFSKCLALSQENTPESRKAIIDELTSLEIGDMATLEQIKKFISEEVERKQKEEKANLERIEEIKEENSQIEENEDTKIRF